MRVLSIEEVSIVAGGLSVEPPKEKSWAEWISELASSIYDALFGGGSSSTPTAQMPTITGSDLGQMQRDCLAAGGSFSYEMNSSSAGASMRVVDVNGNESYAHIQCTAPSN